MAEPVPAGEAREAAVAAAGGVMMMVAAMPGVVEVMEERGHDDIR